MNGRIDEDARIKTCCGSTSRVLNSRITSLPSLGVDVAAVYRRRKCEVCGQRWSTAEVSSEILLDLGRKQEKLSRVISTIAVELKGINHDR